MLKQKYKNEVKSKLHSKFGYKNVHQIPKLEKVVLNMSTAKHAGDKQILETTIDELTRISGQKPIITKARRSISNFKLREGQTLGVKVTLRGSRMYDFIERFINLTAPRMSDFRGLKFSKSGSGCYSFGIDDQLIFPEVNPDKIKATQGMGITIVTSAKTDEECFELLSNLGMPFKKN